MEKWYYRLNSLALNGSLNPGLSTAGLCHFARMQSYRTLASRDISIAALRECLAKRDIELVLLSKETVHYSLMACLGVGRPKPVLAALWLSLLCLSFVLLQTYFDSYSTAVQLFSQQAPSK